MNDLDVFLRTYLSLLIESNQNDVFSDESIISRPLSWAEIQDLIDNTILVNPDEDDIEILYDPQRIIKESKYFHDILDSVLNAKFDEIFDTDRILREVDAKWKMLSRLRRNVKPFYVFKFDFLDSLKIQEIIRSYIRADDEDLVKEYAEKWMKKLTNSCGAFISSKNGFNDFKAIWLNSNRMINYALAIHEFTHYLQDILGFDLTKLRKSFRFEYDKLKFLKLNAEELEALKVKGIINEKEMMAYVNEFIEVSKTIYDDLQRSNNDKLSPKLFIEYVDVSILSDGIYSSDFYKMFSELSESTEPLYAYVCCMIFNLNKNRVIKRFEDELKR